MDSDLAERRRALLRKRLAMAGLAGDSAAENREVTRRRDRGRAPLSPAQRQMWVLHRADPTGAAYNVCLDVTFSGPLDLPALRDALRGLVIGHEVLRTRYPLGADDLPYQLIDPAPEPGDLPIPLADLRGRPAGTAGRLIAGLAGYRFDLARDWPVRMALWRTGDQEHRLGLLVHHIAWDGGTWPALSADLSAGYAAALAGGAPPARPPVQYGDFCAAWERQPPGREDRDYWRRQLAGLPGPLPLPADRPVRRRDKAGDQAGPSGGRRNLVLGDAESAALHRLAADSGVTVFTVLLAAFGALLHRYTGRADLPIGTAAMNRDSAAAQRLAGNFGNTLLLRLEAAGDPEFSELLRRADRVAAAGFAHQDLPYDEVIADLRRGGEQIGGEAFNVMLLVLAQGLAGPDLPGVMTTWRNVHNGTHQFDLSLEVFLAGGRAEIEATYSSALFSAARVDELLLDLRGLLAAVAARPGTRLSALPVPERAVAAPGLASAEASAARPAAGDGGAGLVGRIRALMAELLETGQVAHDADFFALGGNSLLSTRLVARVRAELGADISLRTVTELRTPQRIAAAAATAGRTAGWRAVRPAAGGPSDEADRPLSAAQHALWFLFQANGPSPDYNVAFARRLSGPLDIPALRAALADLLERHEALRTVIQPAGDGPGQTGDGPRQSALDTETALASGALLRECPVGDLEGEMTAALGYAFDPAAEPAFRPALFRLGDAEAVLLLLTHHLFADEWSETVLWHDLAHAYRARAVGHVPEFAALPVSYADYARWQRAALGGPRLGEQRDFWRAVLAGLPEQIDLPADRPRSPGLPTAGDAVTVPLPRAVATGLRALAQRHDASPFTVWHALVALLLYRNGGGTDLPLGTPVSGRGTAELDGVVGMFVNSVVLRSDLSGNPTFGELVTRLAATGQAAFAHQDLPFERVVDLLDPPRVLGRNPLFQTMVVYSDAAPARLRLPEVTDRPLTARLEAAKFDLSITLTDDPAGPPSVTVRYRTALFERATALRLAGELGQLAGQVAADPDRPLARIDHLPPAERTRLLRTWNATAAPVSETSLPEILARQAAATPDAVAAVCGADALTYRELEDRAGRLAAELIVSGAGPESMVGIHLDRSLDLVIALVAVQRTGGAFVPLEPGWPRRRVEDALRATRPALLISHDPAALDWTGIPARAVEPAGGRPGSPATVRPVTVPDPENLAYVMFTSGSTGVPKGAMIRHRAIASRLLWQRELLGFGPGDAALFKAPLGFDISINEIFLPLVCGAKLVICPPGQEREVDTLAGLIAAHRVTFCYLTPTMLALLLDAAPARELSFLRHVWCGGELLTPELFARFRSAVNAIMYHGYGPAETTIGVSHEVYRSGHERGAVTIGRPNPNTAIYLLDEWLRPVSAGVPGELYVGGLLLGRGYAGEPRRTAERFVASPFGPPGARLYRTGDLARWRPDGVLEFLGRADNQVKIRGMRVELEEVEAALARHPSVGQAAARLHDGPSPRLVGYQVPVVGPVDKAGPIDEAGLRAWLAGQLPGHMVPERIIALASLPMLPSGKVDRAALPAPDVARAMSRPPSGAAETWLAALFAQVLGLSEVGAHDDFFALGGDSILSIQLVAAARAAGLRFTVRDVFSTPTVAGLAPRMSAAGAQEPLPATVAPGGAELPLSPLQHGLLFLSLADESEPDAYIAQLTIAISGDVDPARLRRALEEVVGRHDSLRAAFHHAGRANPVQVIASGVRTPWEEIDLTGHPAPDREHAWRELRERQRGTRFALDRAPLLRATLVRFGDDEYRLLLTNHHLLFDGWSLPLLVHDLLAAYAALPDGGADVAVLPPAAGQYPRYLDWLATRDRAAAERAWRAALEGIAGPTLLAGGRDTAYEPSAEHEFTLGADLTGRLTQMARDNGVTMHTVLLAAWGVLLGLLTGESDVLLGSTVSGRPADLAGAGETVGLFINTVPARVTAGPGDGFVQVLRDARARQVDLLDHQHLGLADIQRAVGLGELFDTLLVFESYPVSRSALDDAAARAGLRLAGLDSADDTHYPLTVLVSPGDDLRITLKFRPGAFDQDWVRGLGARLRALLAWCAAHPGTPLARFDPLLPGEPACWTGPAGQALAADDLLAGFDRSVRQWPDRVALRAGDQALTYAELGRRVSALASGLCARGAGPERVVGIAMRRRPELVIGVLATLRAGAAFLPLDPDQPAARLFGMIAEAEPVTVLTTADAAAAMPADAPLSLIDGGATAAAPPGDSALSGGSAPVPVEPGCPAYLIYTSGSTGAPKGAMVTRAGLGNRLAWMAARHGIGAGDVIVAKTPIGFDVSVWELVLPFLVGAQLVLARPDGHRDPAYLARLIRARGVTTVHFVPSMLRAFVEEPEAARCVSLRRIVCSGEELPAELAQRCGRLLDARLYNLYGPTEASIDVTAARYDGQPGPGVPIGQAADGVELRVLDAALRPVPPGVAGELYLGGVQVARGYHGRAALTASRFVADPLGSGSRLYRTGDIVRALPDGTLVYLGRDDDQVKIRGVRVEPAETAAVLAARQEVADAVVVPRPDGPGGTWLVAYVVPARSGPGPRPYPGPRPDPELDPERLRMAVAEVLPTQFVPGAVVVLDRLPVTGSGKLDRRALPPPARPDGTGARPPRGPVEARFCALFAEVLGLETVSPDGNFFVLGGDSISALRLTSLARTAGLRCTPRQVFEAKTPAGLARVAARTVTAAAGSDGTGDIPLTPIMYRLLDRGGPVRAFSQSVLLRTPAGLTEPGLAAGLRAVLTAHDVLRARLVRAAEPWLRVDRSRPAASLRRVAGVPDAAELARIAGQAARELDPEEGRMMSAVWFDAGPAAPGRLLLVAHHLVTDGVSWRILAGDLAGACRGLPVEPAGTSFRAWSFGLRRQAPALAGELRAWREMLDGPPSRLVSRPLSAARDVLGATARIEVRAPAGLTRTVLTTLPQALRAQTQDVLLAAFAVALAQAGEPNPLLRLEGHGREEDLVAGSDLARTVGWFTTAFPVRLEAGGLDPGQVLAGGPAAGPLVRRVRDTLRGLPHRGAGYGILRHLLPRTAAELGRLPEPVIGFNYLGRFDSPSEDDWSLVPGALSGDGDPGMPVAHALDVNVLVDDEGLRSSWTYLPELMPAEDVSRMAGTWLDALHGLARYGERPDAATAGAGDFTLVRVSAGQLDRLRQRFEN